MIDLKNVSKRYEKIEVVSDITLAVARGEFLALVGESGSGKTTTLKMVNRLVERSAGTIEIDGTDIMSQDGAALRRGIGYVFQGVGLLPHLTIRQNIGIVPRLLGWSAAQIKERITELLELLNLSAASYADRYPHELSGGQRQRIGLARALAARPAVMLMDEPFGAVDHVNRDRLQIEFRKVHDKAGLTTIMVTHDMTEALLMADRVAVMLEGKLVRVGTPFEVMNHPTHPYVESLMASPKRQAQVISNLAHDGRAEDA